MIDHLIHVMVAVTAGLLVPVAAGILEANRAGRQHLRVAVAGRLSSVPLSRRGSSLSAPLQHFARKLAGDRPGPVKHTLGLHVTDAGVPGLRWKLYHAGWGDRSVLWYRGQQILAAGGMLVWSVIAIDVAALPASLFGISILLALLTGHRGPRLMLDRRIARRQERLRRQLVPFLYGMAAFLAAGQSIDWCLDRLSERPGELAAELRDARLWQFRGAYTLLDGLDRFVARCGTPEVRDALLLIIAARDDAIRRDHAPRLLTEQAELVRAGIRERRKIAAAHAALRTVSLGTMLALPVIGTAVLYPALNQTLRTLFS